MIGSAGAYGALPLERTPSAFSACHGRTVDAALRAAGPAMSRLRTIT